MRQIIVSGLVLLANVAVASIQQPLSTPPFRKVEPDEYQFDWPIQRVAVIGAGPSGLIAYRELTEAGLDVRIFERDSVPGGIWHYTDQIPLNAPVPNVPASISAFLPSLPPPGVTLPYIEDFEDDGEIWRDHRGPKPIWESLTSNVPSPLHQFPQWPWPPNTPWELTQYQVRNYIRSYASYLNINSNDANPATAYNTRVERVEKRMNEAGEEQGWRLWLKSIERTRGNNNYRATWWTEDFDAVVVAVGTFNAPSMPSIPGLGEWARRFPDVVHHSRQYRRPGEYANKTVLIVGASVSGAGISVDLNREARKIYQSFRPDNNNASHFVLENYLRQIPPNTTLVGEIRQFLPVSEGSSIQSGLVELMNGTILSGIDSVILATGFRYSFPFLSQYYDGAIYEPHTGSAPTVSSFLPLDGLYIRDLYLDQFYIHDPTLAFLGMPLGSLSFIVSDYTSLALAKVWTNKAKLPSSETMKGLYEKTVEERGGYGKYVLFWGPERSAAMSGYLIGWLNSEAYKYGGKQVDAFPKYLEDVLHYWIIAHQGGPLLTGCKKVKAMLTSLGIAPRNIEDGGTYKDISSYDYNW